MLAEFSIVPIGRGESLGDEIAKVLDIVDKSALPYKATPMGTVLEGEWDAVMRVIRECHRAVMNDGFRTMTTIAIDDRPGKPNRLTEKIASVERRLGRTVQK